MEHSKVIFFLSGKSKDLTLGENDQKGVDDINSKLIIHYIWDHLMPFVIEVKIGCQFFFSTFQIIFDYYSMIFLD